MLFSDRDPGARWSWWAVPVEAWNALPENTRADPDAKSVSSDLRARRLAHWPQELGYRVVRRLAERGRIAFVLVHESNNAALRRAMRDDAFSRSRRTRVHRVDAETFARCVAEAGEWPFRRHQRAR